ncbi:MAG TPA: arsenate reductase ArsC [Candidatus Gastranaerophilales bacterium]|nr:arsenate reductase ArsC [Candidatus Gastranaerophilales bacterium]
MKKRVLFLCTGNSCRSQMAEGLMRQFYGDKYDVYSAGVNPTEVNPNAIKVMKEIGIDISNHTSKSVNEYINQTFDIIITVCDNAKESCPIFPGKAERLHWSFFDPAEAIGTQEELLKAFTEVRDQIKDKIHSYFKKGGKQ